MNKRIVVAVIGVVLSLGSWAETFELFSFGNFDQWLTRNIKESKILGGHTKQLYAIAPTGTDNSGKAYTNRGGSPWATSNVLAKPAGVTKASNAVYPEARGKGKCAKLVCQYEHCKAIGMINIDVVAGGSIFLGKMIEPIKSTKNPYSKMEMGIPFTRRPKALRFDYKVSVPAGNTRVYSSGFGKKKTLSGSDKAVAIVLLQRRWEDSKGNLYANRIGTGYEAFGHSSSWVNGHDVKVTYGKSNVYGLIPTDRSYYAKNSKGKMVPVKEMGWEPEAKPTHIIVMFSASSGEAYVGTIDLTFWVDNVGLVY